MSEFKYEIVQRLGVLSQSGTGWTKELNLIRWNGREPRYDIREWSPDRLKMSKGISLTTAEMALLVEMANEAK